jgi:hypothetical protein
VGEEIHFMEVRYKITHFLRTQVGQQVGRRVGFGRNMGGEESVKVNDRKERNRCD